MINKRYTDDIEIYVPLRLVLDAEIHYDNIVRRCPILIPEKGDKIQGDLVRMVNDDDLLEGRLKSLRYKLSDAQRRYYFGVCVTTVMKWYHSVYGESLSKDEVYHMDLKSFGTELFIREVVDPITGELMPVISYKGKTLSQMNTKEGTEFINHCFDKWSKLGCIIEEPRGHNFLTDFI